MTHSKLEMTVGFFVIGIALWFIFFTAGIVGLSASSTSGQQLTANFRSVSGISVGTDVRLAGVKIGSVSSVMLDPQSYRANTILNISSDYLIPDDSIAVISSEGLLGGSFVEILPGGSEFNMNSGDSFEDTQGAVSLLELLLKFVGGGDS